MFDAAAIIKLLSLLTANEKLLLSTFVNTISEQSHYKNSNLILEFGWQGVDLVSEDFIPRRNIGNVGMDQSNQGSEINAGRLRKFG